TIGENCLVVAQVGISGSVQIGDGVTLAGQVGVADHLKIGSGAIVAARSGVIKDVDCHRIVSGFPARDHSKEKRVQALKMKLPEFFARIKKLEKMFDKGF
ncbi:UDP-3-O-(3-hydroxymyristoyl)glucosamine N-acyltransferase, partial [bacterium]|nr:UDP-3-O-(3-hydroxymyristoyl)glucosamine N-acyltransferase [bacterium]